MALERTDVQSYTREQVAEVISDALELVAAFEPPEDLRPVVFTEASRLLSAKQILLTQAPTIADAIVRPVGT